MKNKVKVIIIIIILFLNFIYYFIPKDYKNSYDIGKYKINEEYIKDERLYAYDIQDDVNSFQFRVYGDYSVKKKSINEIKRIDFKNGYCLLATSKKINYYPVCIEDGEYKSFYLINEVKDKLPVYFKQTETTVKKYKNITINDLNNSNYLLWNYNSFYYLSDNNKTIDLFDNDYYQINLASKVNNYLFIPNYDDGYVFNDAYVINFKNGKKEHWKLKYDISIDSRILGTSKKSIYLLDEKNKILYEIVPHKKKIRKVGGCILENGKLKKYNINTIINGNLSFSPINYFQYDLLNSDLYLINNNNKILIAKNVSSIISQEKDRIYYLVGDMLFVYNPYYGAQKLITNFEWKFNFENMIFIY